MVESIAKPRPSGSPIAEPERADYKVRISSVVIDKWLEQGLRAADGSLLTMTVGERDSEGFVELFFTIHYDDNIIDRAFSPHFMQTALKRELSRS